MMKDYALSVYAGVLGKVIGVYMGRPVEGWRKPSIQEKVGQVDRYVASELEQPLVVADDDISGTLTFIRALEDSGELEKTPVSFFGKTWLNYLFKGQTILWWGGVGISTEHTAYQRLRQGYPAPLSGSAKLNGTTVSEQIGAQIFIDAYGLVTPGNPALAADLARKAASVSHDGEAVNGAVVVAVMVSAAFTVKNMEQLLDQAVTYIPKDSLIAQVHQDVRKWVREDGDWQVTLKRIEDKYGYQLYGGGCHIVPNHAIMVMAWAYAQDNFRLTQTIVNTAGYDTDCNAGNVGAVMGVMLGLDGICKDYDFRAPMADRLIIPTADGTSAVSDCWNEARLVARLGKAIQKEQTVEETAPVWMDFGAPGAVHGFMPMVDCADRVTLANPEGKGMVVTITKPEGEPVRIETPVCPWQGEHDAYQAIGTSKLYSGMKVTADIQADDAVKSTVFLVVANEDGTCQTVFGEPLLGSGKVEITVPDTKGYPVKNMGLEFETDKVGDIKVAAINAGGAFHYASQLLPVAKQGISGWLCHVDHISGSFSDDKMALRRFISDEDRSFVLNGNRWWRDVTIQSSVTFHTADQAGLVVAYQGTQRYVSLTWRREQVVLALQNYGETVLDSVKLHWPTDQTRVLKLQLYGNSARGYVDGTPILQAENLPFSNGAAGFVAECANIGVGQVQIDGTAIPVL